MVLDVETADGRTITFVCDAERGWFIRSPRGQDTRIDERPVVGFPILEVEYTAIRSTMVYGHVPNPLPMVVRVALSSSEYWADRALRFLAAGVDAGDDWPVELRPAVLEASKRIELSQQFRHRGTRLLTRLGGYTVERSDRSG
jgi:hypothetical protein